MNSLRRLAISARSFSEYPPCISPAKRAKMKEMQRLMQMDDGKPVYLKKGASDRIIYAGILVYTFLGVVYTGHSFYNMIYPGK